MKLVKKWSYAINSYDAWFVYLYNEGDNEHPYWYFQVRNESDEDLIRGYMNGNPRTEPSLSEILLSMNYIVARISHYMPMEAEEMSIEEDNG